MISRRLFLRLVSWSSVSALLWDPASAVALEEAPESQSPAAPEPEFDYRVSTVRGITDIDDWRAERTEEDVVLRWRTAFEYKIDRFVIEHQRPSQEKTGNWERLTFLEAKGTTLNSHEYRHVASGLDAGTHRFRLKQVDEEGRTDTTDPVSVSIDGILEWAAEDTEEGVTLRWEAIFFDRPPERFVVEQTPAGKEEADWQELGTVEGKGDPARSTAYRYVADELPPGGHHFRLKRVDRKGTATYTDPVSIRANGILEWAGEETAEGIELRWRTAFATPDDTFVVEHRREHGENGKGNASWKTLEQLTEEDGDDRTQYRYVATDLVPGEHRFRLKRVRASGETTHTESLTVQRSMETAVRMTPPSPNPVQGQATFSFAVREAQRVTITVYDVMGREVRTVYRGTPPAEENQTVRLQGRDLSSGIYFVRLVAGDHVKTRRFTVVR
jgi:hypothetical protein